MTALDKQLSKDKSTTRPTTFVLSSLAVAVIAGISSASLMRLPFYHWSTKPGPEIIALVLIVGVVAQLRSRSTFRLLAVFAFFVAAMWADVATFLGYRLALLCGVALAQIGLVITHALPPSVRFEKLLLWALSTYVQSVWFFDFVSVGEHMSFFGPSGTR